MVKCCVNIWCFIFPSRQELDSRPPFLNELVWLSLTHSSVRPSDSSPFGNWNNRPSPRTISNIVTIMNGNPQEQWNECFSRLREVPRDVRGDRKPAATVLPPRRRRGVPTDDLILKGHPPTPGFTNANNRPQFCWKEDRRTLQVFSSSDQDLRISPSSPQQPKPPLPYFCAQSKSSRLNVIVIDKRASELTCVRPS